MKTATALYEQLHSVIARYMDTNEQKLVARAYEFSKRAHGETKRASGHAYITHPLSVAIFLAELQLDAQTLAAALLHDVAEDTPVTAKEIERVFGSQVSDLVAGVTKLARVRLSTGSVFVPQFFQRRAQERLHFENQVESLRRMLLAMAKDIRVILIKLADRLHNMQTLESIPASKRPRIAQETLEIYAPLAYRLGMGEIKGQLEDLAFPYVYPDEYQRLQSTIGEQLQAREAYIERFLRVLQTFLESEGLQVVDLHGRAKHLYSLWKKLHRYDGDLSKIYDLVAIRVVVAEASACYQALGHIHSRWNPLLGRIKDYIATPKPNGYRSLHTTVFGLDGEIVEIQIRTPQMHEQAEYGIAAHWYYAETKTAQQEAQRASRRKLSWLRELHRWQESLKDPTELKRVLELDFFSDQIFVFTPKGEVINLPAQSTPVDFAYAIHSDVGNACSGAKVNGKLVRFDTQLSNGDIVEILMSKRPSGPKRDWLRVVQTQKARSHIKSYFNLK